MELPVDRAGASRPSTGSPALASRGLETWLHRNRQPATIMGSSTRFAWCALEDEVVLLASPGAVRFPNAILANDGWEMLDPGQQILIGSGGVLGRGVDWRVVRWWDPSVSPIAADRSEVLHRLSSLPLSVSVPACRLGAALVSRDREAVIDAGCDMLGAGGGLTPESDDRLLGALAGYRHVTGSLGHPEGSELIDALADELLDIASGRTTLLSVTLLRHALAGEVPDPVADLMRSVTGRGDVTAAVQNCLSLGGSSGRAMAHGVLIGARAGWEVAA